MAWADLHSQSESLASEAEATLSSGNVDKARVLYEQAAEAEARGLEQLEFQETDIGISAVSAASLVV